MTMTPSAYLARIGYGGQPAPDLATLRALHLAHLRTVPFENLGIHANRPVELDEAALVAKIVEDGRGGICYELNAAFAWLLRRLGFDVALLAANVHVNEAELTPDFDHMVLLVHVHGGRWLADVGFGDSFLAPLDLDAEGLQHDGAAHFGVARTDALYTVFRASDAGPAGARQSLFRFETVPRALDGFRARARFHQDSPDSHFRRKIVCTRATDDGRITLRGGEWIVAAGGVRTVEAVDTPAQVHAILHDHFGIDL